ncbi:tripartite tricarboxylate transporter substrate binding protein [Pseudomonas sp.]|uniref:Bug family tripartite tricarboxylate transporter substrate binding protein n=1 Tax=Pseudomonas sp. TaxID=306 RepID=UPI0025FD4EF8|nr:tripartite tricarboxylate transporter substrate binding protein [Pseudomonas sp.]
MIQFPRRTLIAFMVLATTSLAPGLALADDYPSRPIELVVPFQPGGGTDAVARAFGVAAQKHFPKGVVVVNKSGASGGIGWNYMMNAKPDGYTLGVVTVEMVILPHLNLFNRTYADVTPIAQLNADPASIIVRADSPYKTIDDFIAAARKEPGKLAMGTSGNGSIYDIAAAAFEEKTQLQFNRIPYQGAAPSILSLLSNQVDAVSASPGEVAVHIAAGKLRILAVMADKRLAEFKDVPTMKERNVDLSIGTWRGIMGPKGLPPEVVKMLRSSVAEIAKEPELQNTLKKLNLGYVYADDEGFKTVMARDNKVFKDMIPRLKIVTN